MSEENKYILEVKDLHTSFFTENGEVQAVNGISFTLEPGKTLGIVGESGSGKSVTAYSIMQILAETGKITSGDKLQLQESQAAEDRTAYPLWRHWPDFPEKSADQKRPVPGNLSNSL